MKLTYICAALLCASLCVQVVHSQDLDAAVTKLTEDLAAKIKENGNKKITVLDFTDLQGSTSELGRYVAEQLTVDFAMNKRPFAVLDRANLKKIMAENKMSVSGLVNPENAKKLGQFSGVDAILFGTIVPLGKSIGVSVRVVTTETAEVVGGSKTKFTADETVQQLLSQATKADEATDAKADASRPPQPPLPKALAAQPVGDLVVSVDKLIKLDQGGLMVNLSFQNKSGKNTVAAAMFHYPSYVRPCILQSTIVAGDGTQYITDDSALTGIGSTRFSPTPLTEISPGGTAKATITYRKDGWVNDKVPKNIISFTWQADVVVNQNYQVSDYDNYRPDENALPPHCKIQHLSMDIQLPRDE
jgi:TolB-like protein